MLRKTSVLVLLVLLPVSAIATQINGFDTGVLQVVKVAERASNRAAIANIKHVATLGNWRKSYPATTIYTAGPK